MNWNVGYSSDMEEFYIQQEGREALYHYNILPPFGESLPSFAPSSPYQTLAQRIEIDKEKELEKEILKGPLESPQKRSSDKEESYIAGKNREARFVRTESMEANRT
jgi:actin-related protein